MSLCLNLGQWNHVFAVPAAVVDSHIKLASEAQLKVLLYLLRHAGEDIGEEALSSALRISGEEVHNAVEFWKDRELLIDNGEMLTPAAAVDTAAPQCGRSQIPEPKKPHTVVSRAQRPDSAFVSDLLRKNTYLAALLEEAQSVLKKPLSPGDTATVVMLYDTFGLPCEVIAILLNYLDSIGSANMRALEKYGIRWADEGIKTVADAQHEIVRMTESSKAWESVSKLLGIRSIGNPTRSQLEHADRWLNIWCFSDEMITEAYERCVNTKGEYNIRYINAILKKWYEKGIKSMDSLKEAEAGAKTPQKRKARSSKGSMFSLEGASFDINKFENDSLFDD